MGASCEQLAEVGSENRMGDSDRHADPMLDSLDRVIERLDNMNSRLNVVTAAIITQTIAIVGLIATVLLTG